MQRHQGKPQWNVTAQTTFYSSGTTTCLLASGPSPEPPHVFHCQPCRFTEEAAQWVSELSQAPSASAVVAEHIGGHMKAHQAKGKDVSWHIHDERALLALQGPLAAPALQKLAPEDLCKMYFSDFKVIPVSGIPCFVTRTG